jgi:hypothetical protein
LFFVNAIIQIYLYLEIFESAKTAKPARPHNQATQNPECANGACCHAAPSFGRAAPMSPRMRLLERIHVWKSNSALSFEPEASGFSCLDAIHSRARLCPG